MLEIEYIPLKTPDGTTCGHARVRGGYVELSLRAPLQGAALVITENGSSAAAVGRRVPVGAQVSAVALHNQGRLACCGFSRTAALDTAALRRRLQALSPAAPVNKPVPAPAPEPKPAPPMPAPLVEEIAAAIPVMRPPAPEPEPKPAPEPPDVRSREALYARAGRVLRHIDTQAVPVPEAPARPEPAAAADVPAAALDAPADTPADTPAEQWARSADALLASIPAAFVPNPFPHIFPGAQFSRGEGDALEGAWQHGRYQAEISAVPGPYSPQPPPQLAGYTRYIRARSGGYWVRVTEN